MPDNFERRHIIEILLDSIGFYYPIKDEPQTYVKFKNDKDFLLGEYITPCGSKNGFALMRRDIFSDEGKYIFIVVSVKEDKDGCLLAMKFKSQ